MNEVSGVEMASYNQFCPVAKAMEVLDERWTLLVVRELLAGSTHFNELRRGVPRMSPALLSKRLRTLQRAGVIRRTVNDRNTAYQLTQCGRELADVVQSLGAWGVRWISELGEADLDPHLLFWDMRRTIDVERWPRTRTVVLFELDGVEAAVRSWWLVVSGSDVDLCDFDPGHLVDYVVSGSLRVLTEVWRGDRTWESALDDDSVRILGPKPGSSGLPGWIGQAPSAAVPRAQTIR